MLILPFLIIAGASALAPVSKVDALDLTRFLSREEKVQIRKLTNGVTTFIQENPHPRQCASFRVVMKGASHEDAFFSLDTSMESTEAVEQFFNFCQENCQGSQSSMGIGEGALTCGFQSTFDLPSRNGSGQNLAVIAVGDFVESAMLSMIEHYFDALAFNEDPEAVAMPIQIGKSSMGSGVALHIDYPLKRSELQTYGDLKESWLHIFAQELLQQRMERCTRSLRENWVHPHSRFIYPVHGYALASVEASSNVLSFLLWEIEQIKMDGFNESEFLAIKDRVAHQLNYLSGNFLDSDSSRIASFYADGFGMGKQGLSYESFLNASQEVVPSIEFKEIKPYIRKLLVDANRFIHVRYPENHRSRLLTMPEIEEMIERISGLAEFESDAYCDDDDIMLLDNRVGHRQAAPQLLGLAGKAEAGEWVLNVNDMQVENLTLVAAEVDLFETLPITSTERDTITYIITNMAEKNIFELAFDKKKMEDKGKRINHVHPLRFMGHIFSSPDLKRNVKRIKKSSFKWDAFIDGFAKRMKEESSRNNLLMYVNGFAKTVNASPEKVTYYIQKKDWEGLVRYLM